MYIDFTISSKDYNFMELKQLFPNALLIEKGEKLKSGKIIPYNEFSLNFEKSNLSYIDELISAFKVYIGNNLELLYNFFKTSNLMSSVCIVLKEMEEQPAISISHENLTFLCKLNANIDFDFI